MIHFDNDIKFMNELNEELKDICYKNKVYIRDRYEMDEMMEKCLQQEAINKIKTFLEKNHVNGCYDLELGDEQFNLRIKYKGGENPKENDNMKFECLSCGTKINKKIEKCSCGSRNIVNIVDSKKIKIILPSEGKIISKFADEVAECIREENVLFYRQELKEIVEVTSIKKSDGNETIGFSIIKPKRLVTIAEKFLLPGREAVIFDRNGMYVGKEFKEKSISVNLADICLHSHNMQDNLKQISRIFTSPIPIIYNNKLTFPKKGYDERFYSWTNHDAPEIENTNMKLDEAKEIINKIFEEFCFETEQDKHNAIAGLLTPFLRGLFSSFSTRTPVFFYLANRERAGKDYLAGITGILYEGKAMEEPPISSEERSSNSNEELRKKVLSSLMTGKKRLHFANNKGYLNNAVFEGIVTAETYSDRILGRNEIATFDNEMDFSLSGNIGISFTPDFANRSIFVKLFLDIEDANTREFKTPNLHKWISQNRGTILSALYCLVNNWFEKGQTESSLKFASFHEWANICGGIMESAGYLNPCKIDKVLTVGGDSKTNDMKALFEVCYEKYPETWISKHDIRDIMMSPEFDGFQDLDFSNRSNQTKIGTEIIKFYGRILSGIKMEVQDLSIRSSRHKIKFTKIPQKTLNNTDNGV